MVLALQIGSANLRKTLGVYVMWIDNTDHGRSKANGAFDQTEFATNLPPRRSA